MSPTRSNGKKITTIGSLVFTKAKYVPPFATRGSSRGIIVRAAMEFAESGAPTMFAPCESSAKAAIVATGINNSAKRHDLPIKAGVRDKVNIFVWRTDKIVNGSPNGEMHFA